MITERLEALHTFGIDITMDGAAFWSAVHIADPVTWQRVLVRLKDDLKPLGIDLKKAGGSMWAAVHTADPVT